MAMGQARGLRTEDAWVLGLLTIGGRKTLGTRRTGPWDSGQIRVLLC